MVTVALRPLLHRGTENIGLYAPNDATLNLSIRKLPGIKWSQTHRCWYLPLSEAHHQAVLGRLRGAATVDDLFLRQYWETRGMIEKSMEVPAGETAEGKLTSARAISLSPAWKLGKENLQALNSFMQLLKLKAYSASTLRTYRNEFLQLLQVLKNKPVNDLTPEDLRRYMVYCLEKQKISEHTANSRLNAIKFYFEQVLKRERFFFEIPRPKKRKQLPGVFNQDEVAAIINGTKNKKHKAMLMLAYSAGLRVSEVVAIRTADVDSKRMCIFIRQAKGKKDRWVGLSPVLLVMLREYAKDYKPDRGGYLFEGNSKGLSYSTRSLQEVLQAAKRRAGILKPGSVHSLRHSFATHLVDRGTDISMIQKLLGHASIKTTLRYLHTSNKDLMRIISPLDDLDLKL